MTRGGDAVSTPPAECGLRESEGAGAEGRKDVSFLLSPDSWPPAPPKFPFQRVGSYYSNDLHLLFIGNVVDAVLAQTQTSFLLI